MRIATPKGPYPSYETSSIITLSNSPTPFLIALSIFEFGIFSAFAFFTACRSLGFESISLPPSLEETVISLLILEKSLPLF